MKLTQIVALLFSVSSFVLLFINTIRKNNCNKIPLTILVIVFFVLSQIDSNLIENLKIDAKIISAQWQLRKQVKEAEVKLKQLVEAAKTFAGIIVVTSHSFPNINRPQVIMTNGMIDQIRLDLFNHLQQSGLKKEEVIEAIKSEYLIVAREYCYYITLGSNGRNATGAFQISSSIDVADVNKAPDELKTILEKNKLYKNKSKKAFEEMKYYINNKWFNDYNYWKNRADWDFSN